MRTVLPSLIRKYKDNGTMNGGDSSPSGKEVYYYSTYTIPSILSTPSPLESFIPHHKQFRKLDIGEKIYPSLLLR
jgi:hypothetical protein